MGVIKSYIVHLSVFYAFILIIQQDTYIKSRAAPLYWLYIVLTDKVVVLFNGK